MVRNSSKRKARRSNAVVRTHLRKLSRAISEQAALVKPPPDPPTIKTYRTHTICTQFVLIASNSATDCEVKSPPLDHVVHLNFKDAASTSYTISSTDLINAWLFAMGHATDAQKAHFEVAVVKACAWGPLPQQISASVSLLVDSGASQRCVVDHGSPMARPRAGISIPKLTWGQSGQKVQVGITPSIKGEIKKDQILGIVQITIAGRMKGSF